VGLPMSESPSRNRRYESLDVWRGVACLMVVVYHSSFYGDFSGAPLVVGSRNRGSG
jgi:peptidoglycan/LPS O-acetylase OafA/YrhL